MLGIMGIILPLITYMMITQHAETLVFLRFRTHHLNSQDNALPNPTKSTSNPNPSTFPMLSNLTYSALSVSSSFNLSRSSPSIMRVLHLAVLHNSTPLNLHKSTHSKLSYSTSSGLSTLPENISVAIGLGITSKLPPDTKIKNGYTHSYEMPLFSQLLPSFCATASKGYAYHFYLAYDFNDKFYSDQSNIRLLKQVFHTGAKKCVHLRDVGIHTIKCKYYGKPAWAQNDAMMAAYHDGRDFFYRVNDDTILTSSDWTNLFIDGLKEMVPPLVGVVGPTHRGGDSRLLTYYFVHRTHIDIFG